MSRTAAQQRHRKDSRAEAKRRAAEAERHAQEMIARRREDTISAQSQRSAARTPIIAGGKRAMEARALIGKTRKEMLDLERNFLIHPTPLKAAVMAGYLERLAYAYAALVEAHEQAAHGVDVDA